jgi:hypothetical protein
MVFAATSRYAGIPTATITIAGREVVYVRRRFLPQASASVIVAEHSVVERDRLDNVTARYLGDPLQFWRLCDANHAMHPDELTAVVGRRVRIPLPQ